MLFKQLTPKDPISWAGWQLWNHGNEDMESQSDFNVIPRTRIGGTGAFVPNSDRRENTTGGLAPTPTILGNSRRNAGVDGSQPVQTSPRDLRLDTQSQIEITALLDQLLAIDGDALLRPDMQHGNASLRLPTAVMFALAKQPDKALAILQRPVQYERPAPPGGWRNPPGLPPPPDADRPRISKSPSGDEADQLALRLIAILSSKPRSAELVAPLSRRLASDFLAQVKACSTERAMQPAIRHLAALIYQSTIALDPPLRRLHPIPQEQNRAEATQPPDAVDVAVLTPVEAAAGEALKLDGVAKSGAALLKAGILKAMLAARNPQVLDSLFGLMTATLDRYGEVRKDPKLMASEVEYLAGQLESRMDLDLKAYASRLRATYLKP